MFIEILKKLMRDKGISNNKLLTDLGLNKSSILNWEKRGTIPSGETLEMIADYFDVSVDYLLGKTDDPTPSGTEMTEEEKNILGLLHKMSEDELKTVYKIISAIPGVTGSNPVGRAIKKPLKSLINKGFRRLLI